MFELTPGQRDIKQAAREFAEKEFREVARELDEIYGLYEEQGKSRFRSPMRRSGR